MINSKRSILILHRILYLTILLLINTICFAQKNGLFYVYDHESGLPTNNTTCILQDKNGFMWIGTSDGLVKYDGYSFKNFKHEVNSPYSITDNLIFNFLFEDNQQNICFYSSNDNINLFNQATEKSFSLIDLRKLNKLTKPASFVFSDKNYDIWTSLNHHLYKIHYETDGFYCKVNVDSFKIQTQTYFVDKEKNIWFASNLGIYFYDIQKKSMVKFTIQQYDFKNITSIFLHNSSLLYFTEKNTLYSYHLSTKLLNKCEFDYNFISGHTYLLTEEQNYLWLIFNSEIWRINSKTNSKNKIDLGYSETEKQIIYKIKKTKRNEIFIVTTNYLISYNIQTQTIQKYLIPEPYITQNTTFDIQELANGDLYILKTDVILEHCTLYSFDKERNEIKMIETKNLNGFLWKMSKDINDNLWFVGTSLLKFVPTKKGFENYLLSDLNSENHFNEQIFTFSTVLDKIWFSYSSGIAEFDPVTKKQKRLQFSDYFKNKVINCISFFNPDFVFVSMQSAGVVKINLSSNQIEKISETIKSKGYNIDYTSMIYIDKPNTVWFATYRNGIVIYDIQNETVKDIKHIQGDNNSLANNMVWYITKDKAGNFWFSLSGSIDKYNPKTGKITHYPTNKNDDSGIHVDKAMCLYCDEDNLLWIGTFSGGLSMFCPKTNKFTTWKNDEGLSNNTVYGIMEDKNHTLWLRTNFGVSGFDKKTQTFKKYTKHSGILNIGDNNSAFLKYSDSLFLIGGQNGFSAFNPSKIISDSIRPKIKITGFGLFGKMLDVFPFSIDSVYSDKKSNFIAYENKYYLKKNISFFDKIELSYSENYFTIEFAALHYDFPEKNLYRYKLKGIDTTWIYCENRRFVNYNNLPHGEYDFYVDAANPDGLWSDKPAHLKIIIKPPFWKTVPFYSFVSLCLGGFLLFLIKQREKKLKYRNQLLKFKIQESVVEINQMNEELKAQNELVIRQKEEIQAQANQLKESLITQNRNAELALLRSRINPHFLFNTLNNINTLVFYDQQKTHDSILKLSEIMRYMHREHNPEFVPVGDEVNYIVNYVDLQTLRFKSNEFVSMKIQITNPNKPIAPMILIPFIENAFKHCDKKAENPGIKIEIISDDNELYLKVENRFIEKTISTQEEGGFGINNIKRRLDLIYKNNHRLTISEKDNWFFVELKIGKSNE